MNPSLSANPLTPLAPSLHSAQELREKSKGVAKGAGEAYGNREVIRDFVSTTAGMAGAVAYPAIYAHEMGHAVAANAVYQGANPQIEVKPFQGGYVTYELGPLTELGQRLGPTGADALVAGAGTLVDATSSAISFAAGYRMRHKHPVIGHLLMGYAGAVNLNSVAYAASAIGRNLPMLARQGHDFAALALTAGVPPLVSAVVLASLLPAEYAILRWAEKNGI